MKFYLALIGVCVYECFLMYSTYRYVTSTETIDIVFGSILGIITIIFTVGSVALFVVE